LACIGRLVEQSYALSLTIWVNLWVLHSGKEKTVALLVEALRYKPKGYGFDSRGWYWNSSLTSGSTMALVLTQPLTEMSTRNISLWVGGGGGGKGGRGVGGKTLSPSCANCLKICGLNFLQPPRPVQGCAGIALSLPLPSHGGEHSSKFDVYCFSKVRER
jgi:hypothetical protein